MGFVKAASVKDLQAAGMIGVEAGGKEEDLKFMRQDL